MSPFTKAQESVLRLLPADGSAVRAGPGIAACRSLETYHPTLVTSAWIKGPRGGSEKLHFSLTAAGIAAKAALPPEGDKE